MSGEKIRHRNGMYGRESINGIPVNGHHQQFAFYVPVIKWTWSTKINSLNGYILVPYLPVFMKQITKNFITFTVPDWSQMHDQIL